MRMDRHSRRIRGAVHLGWYSLMVIEFLSYGLAQNQEGLDAGGLAAGFGSELEPGFRPMRSVGREKKAAA